MNARAVTIALSSSGVSWLSTGRELAPGLLASAVLAVAAAFLAQHYGAPVMLLALLLGMAMTFSRPRGHAFRASNSPCGPFCAVVWRCSDCALR